MKRILVLFLWSMIGVVAAESREECHDAPSWFKHTCHRLNQIWYQGHNELYATGYAWHNRFTYDKDKLNRYNEHAWGSGFGKGFYDEDGDWHGLSAVAFLDSHKNVEPVAGYTFLKMFHVTNTLQGGAGYSVVATARPDINHGIPFPGVLPWLTLSYRSVMLMATYVPGARGAGNVLFIMGKITL
jgi:palmitoyl transferase